MIDLMYAWCFSWHFVFTITCTNIIYAYNPLMIPSTSQGTSHGKPHHLHTDWNAIAPLNQLFSCLTWERFTSHTKLSCFSYGGVILKSPTLYKDSGMFPLWILGISIIPKYYQSLSAQNAVVRKLNKWETNSRCGKF